MHPGHRHVSGDVSPSAPAAVVHCGAVPAGDSRKEHRLIGEVPRSNEKAGSVHDRLEVGPGSG
jgi:hypothetical protein